MYDRELSAKELRTLVVFVLVTLFILSLFFWESYIHWAAAVGAGNLGVLLVPFVALLAVSFVLHRLTIYLTRK